MDTISNKTIVSFFARASRSRVSEEIPWSLRIFSTLPERNHELKDIAFENLDYQMLTYADGARPGKTRLPLNRKREENSGEHLVEEAEVVFLLAGALFPKLRENGLDKLFFGIEMPLGEVLARMELAGIKINPEILFSMSQEFGEKTQRSGGKNLRFSRHAF